MLVTVSVMLASFVLLVLIILRVVAEGAAKGIAEFTRTFGTNGKKRFVPSLPAIPEGTNEASVEDEETEEAGAQGKQSGRHGVSTGTEQDSVPALVDMLEELRALNKSAVENASTAWATVEPQPNEDLRAFLPEPLDVGTEPEPDAQAVPLASPFSPYSESRELVPARWAAAWSPAAVTAAAARWAATA